MLNKTRNDLIDKLNSVIEDFDTEELSLLLKTGRYIRNVKDRMLTKAFEIIENEMNESRCQCCIHKDVCSKSNPAECRNFMEKS